MKVRIECYAYTHRKPDGAVFYVGAGTLGRAHDFHHRSAAHKQTVAECGGKQNIVVMLTPCDNKELAHATEIALIAHYRAVGEPLVNQSIGGAGGGAGCKRTAETRNLMSIAQLAHYAAHPERREVLSTTRAGSNNPSFGKTPSKETRAKMSAARTGRVVSAETRAKLSAAQRGEKHHQYGKPLSEETKAKLSAVMSGEKSPNFGRTHTTETKAKLSAARYGKRASEETKEKLRTAHGGEKNGMFGKRHNEDTKAKQSAARKAYWVARRAEKGEAK